MKILSKLSQIEFFFVVCLSIVVHEKQLTENLLQKNCQIWKLKIMSQNEVVFRHTRRTEYKLFSLTFLFVLVGRIENIFSMYLKCLKASRHQQRRRIICLKFLNETRKVWNNGKMNRKKMPKWRENSMEICKSC